eukprot:1180672-Prorocentrum_minimum.AAC.2
MDQSDAGSAGIFSRRTHQTQEAWTPEARVYSHDGPIRRRKRGYIYSHLSMFIIIIIIGPIGRRKRGYILTTDQSDAGSAGLFSLKHARYYLFCSLLWLAPTPGIFAVPRGN